MGQPNAGNAALLESEFIGLQSNTWGSETSQYPVEKKTNSDSASSGERTRNSLNPPACRRGLRDLVVVLEWKVERSGKSGHRG